MIPHAVVTGASRGVGLSVTRLLLDRGYRVFAHYRTAPADLQHSRLTWWQAGFLVPLDDAAPGVDKLDEVVRAVKIPTICTTSPQSGPMHSANQAPFSSDNGEARKQIPTSVAVAHPQR